jgi:hypothetical protein
MQAAARLEPLDTKTRRATGRRKLHLGSALSGSGDSVIIHDLSQGGMLIETAAKLARFDQLEVDLPETGVARARVVWNSGKFYGCEFHHGISKTSLSAALLRSPPVKAGPDMMEAFGRAHESAGEDDDEVVDDRLPFGVRLRVILALTLGLWALILWGLGLL